MRSRLAIALLCTALAAAMLFSRGVWAPDEARYAEVTREMKAGGTWLVPILNGETYTQKPPLFFALIRLFSLGSDSVPEWAAKAPSLLAALGTLLLIGWLAQRLAGSATGWMAPLLLGTMGKFAWQSQFGQIDMVVTFLVVAQIALGLYFAEGGGRRPVGLVCMAALGFAGVLGKGPVACVLPWLVLLAFLSARGDWPGLRRLGLPWIALGVVALSALWLTAAGLKAGWDYPESLVLRQTVQRYLDPWHHQAPWYYFLGILLTDGLPYSLFLVPLGIALWRAKTWKEPAVLLPLCWIALYLVFFSLSAGKRSVYILPVYPAMALLLARGAEGWASGEFPLRGFRWVITVLASISAAGMVYAVRATPGEFQGFLPWLLAGGALFFAGSLGALFLSSRPKAALGWIAAGMALLILVVAVPGVRRLDAVKTPRSFVPSASAALAAGGRMGVFPSLIPSVNYYIRTVTPVFPKGGEHEASAFLCSHPANLLLVQAENWRGPVPAHRLVHRGFIGGGTYEIWGYQEPIAAPGVSP
jgi:4-amino-4-deoxy-L-arabinose transferase-like glycosyltransferase